MSGLRPEQAAAIDELHTAALRAIEDWAFCITSNLVVESARPYLDAMRTLALDTSTALETSEAEVLRLRAACT
jgi:hypothetical protein